MGFQSGLVVNGKKFSSSIQVFQSPTEITRKTNNLMIEKRVRGEIQRFGVSVNCVLFNKGSTYVTRFTIQKL